ncbi:MAG: hypothetical protein JJU36_11030 [Phycisphaeraceae bacterium]|nr:hypothetical protein [Phycisphaeraceae bacterium]
MLQFYCGHCGALLQVASDLAGKRGRCPQCQQLNVVPFPRDDGRTARARIAEAEGITLPDRAPSPRPAAPEPSPAGGAAKGRGRPPPPLPENAASPSSMVGTGSGSPAIAPSGGRRVARPWRGLSTNIPAVLGSMLLATMVLPWNIESVPAVVGQSGISVDFSWNLLGDGRAVQWAYLLGLWIIGGVTLLAISLSTGMTRGLTCLLLGVVGLMLTAAVHADAGNSVAWAERTWLFEHGPGWRALWGATLLIVTINAIALHWRAAVGRSGPIHTAVGVGGGVGVVWMLVMLIILLTNRPATDGTENWLITPYYGLVLVVLAWLGTCGLLLADSIRGRGHLAAQAALPLYMGILLGGLLVMVTPVLAAGSGGMMLRSLNLMVLGLGGTLGLVIYGAVEVSIGKTLGPATLRERPAPAARPVDPGPALDALASSSTTLDYSDFDGPDDMVATSEARRHLDALLHSGAISPQEYHRLVQRLEHGREG